TTTSSRTVPTTSLTPSSYSFLVYINLPQPSTLFPYTTLFRSCDDKSAQIYARFDKNDWRIQPAEFYRFHDAEVNTLQVGYANHRSEERFSRNAETDIVCRLLLEKKNKHKQKNLNLHKYT